MISPPKKDTNSGIGKLGDVEGIRARLDKRLGSDELLKVIACLEIRLTLKNLHRVIYKRPGASHEVKKNLRDFTGFHFADTVRSVVSLIMTSECPTNSPRQDRQVHE